MNNSANKTIDPLKTEAALQAQAKAKSLKQNFKSLDEQTINQLFKEARSHNGWQDKPVQQHLIEELYEIVRWGSTSMNCCPARFRFITSDSAKERLKPALAEGNIEKALAAPVIAIIAHDLDFPATMPQLFPHRDVSAVFKDKPEFVANTAFRNGTLQGAYLMLAARALGLDCGPLSGFSNQKVDQEFFAGTQVKSNFLCCLGYGDTSKVFQRLPRLSFKQACEVL